LSSDRSLQLSIERAILQDPLLSATGISVEVCNGLVTLRGTVCSARAKLAAQELAQSMPGCRTVFNEIEIEPAAGRSDHDIAFDIRETLDTHPEIAKGAITVKVDAGLVTLTGAVATPDEYNLVESLTRSIRGVRQVLNQLLIDRTAQDDDESLQLEIESALAEIPELRDDQLRVAVGGDTVVLSGQVHDPRHKELAEEVALSVRPWRVRNEIEVLLR